jgi:hypothetical protein
MRGGTRLSAAWRGGRWRPHICSTSTFGVAIGRGASQFLAAYLSAKDIAERYQPFAWVEERSDDTPGYRGRAQRPRQVSQICQPGCGLAPPSRVLVSSPVTGGSLPLTPRLIAGKPAACDVDATCLQGTELLPVWRMQQESNLQEYPHPVKEPVANEQRRSIRPNHGLSVPDPLPALPSPRQETREDLP